MPIAHDATVVDGLEGTPRDAWLVQMHAERVLGTFLRACDREAIPVLPVKGIVSARTLYADVSERVISDIDVRVRPHDVGRVAAIARREGWRVIQRMRAYDNLVVQVDGTSVDVEGHIGPPGMCSVTVDDFLRRGTSGERLFGFPVVIPDVHDHALLLVVNAFKDHMTQAMAWAIRDLERVVRAPWFDVATLLARAKEAGATTMLWVVADWMARVMEDDAWAGVRGRMGRPGRAAYVSAHQWLESLGNSGAFGLRVLARLAGDDPLRRLVSVGRMVAWQAEVWMSQFGESPYRAGVNVPVERLRNRRQRRSS